MEINVARFLDSNGMIVREVVMPHYSDVHVFFVFNNDNVMFIDAKSPDEVVDFDQVAYDRIPGTDYFVRRGESLKVGRA